MSYLSLIALFITMNSFADPKSSTNLWVTIFQHSPCMQYYIHVFIVYCGCGCTRVYIFQIKPPTCKWWWIISENANRIWWKIKRLKCLNLSGINKHYIIQFLIHKHHSLSSFGSEAMSNTHPAHICNDRAYSGLLFTSKIGSVYFILSLHNKSHL